MPDWSASPAVTAVVASLAAILAASLTSLVNSRTQRQALAHQRQLEISRHAIEREERRLDRRVDATVALVTELRSQIHAAHEFELRQGVAPSVVYDYLPLPSVFDVLTPVVLLCPEAVAVAAEDAAHATVDAVNGQGKTEDARTAIRRLTDEARAVLA